MDIIIIVQVVQYISHTKGSGLERIPYVVSQMVLATCKDEMMQIDYMG